MHSHLSLSTSFIQGKAKLFLLNLDHLSDFFFLLLDECVFYNCYYENCEDKQENVNGSSVFYFIDGINQLLIYGKFLYLCFW